MNHLIHSSELYTVFFSFSNGSVKVRFRVVVNVEDLEDKEAVAITNKVGKTLRDSAKTGQIGNLKVKKTVELRGLYCGIDVSFRSFVRSFVRPFIHSFIRLFLRSFIRSFVRSFARSFVRSFVRSVITPFIPSLIQLSISWFINLLSAFDSLFVLIHSNSDLFSTLIYSTFVCLYISWIYLFNFALQSVHHPPVTSSPPMSNKLKLLSRGHILNFMTCMPLVVTHCRWGS